MSDLTERKPLTDSIIVILVFLHFIPLPSVTLSNWLTQQHLNIWKWISDYIFHSSVLSCLKEFVSLQRDHHEIRSNFILVTDLILKLKSDTQIRRITRKKLEQKHKTSDRFTSTVSKHLPHLFCCCFMFFSRDISHVAPLLHLSLLSISCIYPVDPF